MLLYATISSQGSLYTRTCTHLNTAVIDIGRSFYFMIITYFK